MFHVKHYVACRINVFHVKHPGTISTRMLIEY